MEKDKFAVVEVLVFSLFACQSLMFLIQKKNFVLSVHVCVLYICMLKKFRFTIFDYTYSKN